MLEKSLYAMLAGAIMATAFAVTPADATKRQLRYPTANAGSPSLDGRVLGYPRTCWTNTFIYDNRGVPTGPYCH